MLAGVGGDFPLATATATAKPLGHGHGHGHDDGCVEIGASANALRQRLWATLGSRRAGKPLTSRGSSELFFQNDALAPRLRFNGAPPRAIASLAQRFLQSVETRRAPQTEKRGRNNETNTAAT